MQRTAPPTGYHTDFALWAQEQAAALREGRVADLDLANLLEEIDGLSDSIRNSIQSHMTTMAVHLLKLQYQPERASRSWIGSIVSRVTRIRRRLRNSPSLRRELLDYEFDAYADARELAAAETGLPIATFPETPTTEFTATFRAALAGEDFGGEAIVRAAEQEKARRT